MADPYGKYCSGASHCLNAGKVHLLVYTSDVKEHPWQAATRSREIKRGGLPGGHSVIVQRVDDLGRLKDVVQEAAARGEICEFAIWSHAAIDGPTGAEKVSRDSASCFHLQKQLGMEEWGSIDFNWSEDSYAAFYGCRTAIVPPENGKAIIEGEPQSGSYDRSFAYRFLKKHPSLSAAAGQPWYTYPSQGNTTKDYRLVLPYSEGEDIYSVAWRGSKNEDGGGFKKWVRTGLGVEQGDTDDVDVYWPGVVDEAQAIAWSDRAFTMRVFVRSERGIHVFRDWPNITINDIKSMRPDITPEYPSQNVAYNMENEEYVNRQ